MVRFDSRGRNPRKEGSALVPPLMHSRETAMDMASRSCAPDRSESSCGYLSIKLSGGGPGAESESGWKAWGARPSCVRLLFIRKTNYNFAWLACRSATHIYTSSVIYVYPLQIRNSFCLWLHPDPLRSRVVDRSHDPLTKGPPLLILLVKNDMSIPCLVSCPGFCPCTWMKLRPRLIGNGSTHVMDFARCRHRAQKFFV